MNRSIFYALLCLLVLVASGCQRRQSTKVYGRYVPERKDDFAWENEYAAFRLYGPALAPENPSNGVDLWLKASPELIVDSFYYREHVLGLPYHINYGKGLDCYKVGHTAGCGGLVIVADDRLWTAGPYSSWEILCQTPDLFRFRLTYDSLPVAGEVLCGTLTVTAEAGKMLNKAEVVISPRDGNSDNLPFLEAGGGIFLHDTVENYFIDDVTGCVAYAEDALSDKQAAKMNYDYNGSVSQGRTYAAVVTYCASRQDIIEGTLVSLRGYMLGDTLTYFFGGCWSNWSDGKRSFPTDIDWFDAVAAEAECYYSL